jgi:hypothetical protein
MSADRGSKRSKSRRLSIGRVATVAACLWIAPFAAAQPDPPAATVPAEATPPAADAPAAAPRLLPVDDVIADTEKKVTEIAHEVDQDARAQEVSAGILQPIYKLAEAIAFPAFHWVAFAVMATGVVSFGLQIVLGKLAVLLRGSISFKEILSDALGLVISLTGLVLTTQAAAENSTFTTSPAAVLSASGVGVIAGFIFYIWGQAQELEAAKGRNVPEQKPR